MERMKYIYILYFFKNNKNFVLSFLGKIDLVILKFNVN